MMVLHLRPETTRSARDGIDNIPIVTNSLIRKKTIVAILITHLQDPGVTPLMAVL